MTINKIVALVWATVMDSRYDALSIHIGNFHIIHFDLINFRSFTMSCDDETR